MKNGQVIFFNGTSSSGKTTLAKALQEKLEEPYMYVALDDLFHMYPDRFLNPTNQEEVEVMTALAQAVVSGLQRCVASLAEAGNNVLVDHVLEDEGWLKECIERWSGLDVLFVGVKCPLEVVEQREKARGDRMVGLARYQYERVHIHKWYDLEVDTSVLSTEECVKRIMALVNHKPQETAFQKIRADYWTSAR